MSVIWALTRAGFIEARRNRVTVVVGVFAAVLILLTTVVLNTTVFTVERAVTDFGLGVMSLILVGLSLFLSVGMLSREIERRTVFLVVSRPLSRTSFVVGRYLGIALTLTVLLMVMSVIYGLQLLLFDVSLTSSMLAAILGLWIELLTLSAMGLFFSSFAGQLVAAICVVGLYLVGHWASDLVILSMRASSPLVASVMRGLYYVVPNLDRFDFRQQAAHELSVAASEVASSIMFGLGWTVFFVALAAIVFSRRDFK